MYVAIRAVIQGNLSYRPLWIQTMIPKWKKQMEMKINGEKGNENFKNEKNMSHEKSWDAIRKALSIIIIIISLWPYIIYFGLPLWVLLFNSILFTTRFLVTSTSVSFLTTVFSLPLFCSSLKRKWWRPLKILNFK